MDSINKLLYKPGCFEFHFSDSDIKATGFLSIHNNTISFECAIHCDTLDPHLEAEPFNMTGTVSGVNLTLVNCYCPFQTCTSDLMYSYRITPSEIIIGLSTTEIPEICSISAQMPELNKMYPQKMLKPKYTFPDCITASDKSSKITIAHRFSYTHNFTSDIILSSPTITIQFYHGVPIEDALKKISSARNLFSFFADYHLPLGALTLTTEAVTDGNNPPNYFLYLNYNDDDYNCSDFPDRPFLISISAIQDSFQNIWNQWVIFNDDNHPIVSLFYEILSNHSRRTNLFLNLCQSLEVYSCHCRETDAQILRNIYPKDKYGNKPVTLKHRLEDLMLFLLDYLDLTYEECGSLSQIISNARNYFTHYSRREPSHECIAYSNILLHLMLLLTVYQHLGLKKEDIKSSMLLCNYSSIRNYLDNILPSAKGPKKS